jgi:superfamily II DNA or RNA helicase
MALADMEISEKMLIEAGGWQPMKQARMLVENERVSEFLSEPPCIRALVKDGAAQYRAGLKILGATRIENLCTCRESRQWGKICAHSLAVGLSTLRKPAAAPERTVEKPATQAPAATATQWISSGGKPDFLLHLILPPNFEGAWERGQIMVVAEAQTGAGRASFQSFAAKKVVNCEPLDALAAGKLCAFNDGKPPGMVMLSREQFREFFTPLLAHPRVTFGKSKVADVAELLEKFASGLAADESSDSPKTGSSGVWKNPEFSLGIEGSLNNLSAKLTAKYGDLSFIVGSLSGGESRRNFSAEEAAMQQLVRAGFSHPNAQNEMLLKGERNILRFVASDLSQLEKRWKVRIGERFTNISEQFERIEPRVAVQPSGERWFDLDVSLATPDGQQFSNAEIQRLLRSGQSHVRKPNGKIVLFDGELLDEFQGALADCQPSQTQPRRYRVNKLHAAHLSEVIQPGWIAGAQPAWRDWVTKLNDPSHGTTLPLGPLETTLRPYQKQGVHWMHFLASQGLGGILADEMGLGKTLQTLAFIAAWRAAAGNSLPALIVCPSSLTFNWIAEARRFVPDLKTLLLEGDSRHAQFAKIPEAHLVVTSYALLRRDIMALSANQFGVMVLDEAQHIKNPTTQNAQAAVSLKAGARFALTGTPVENSLLDLWSLMQFSLPGYLGEKTHFLEQYTQNSEQPMPAESNSRLKKRIKPFLLRRMKSQVLPELPEKTEQVLMCPMNAGQRQVHQQIIEATQNSLSELNGKNAGQERMKILAALTRLRQAACDLRLLKLEGKTDGDSGKMELLGELLDELMDSGQRVLIFSQFTTMLGLIRERLKASKTRFCYLDGSTKDRQAEVERFQNSDDIPVFLISLKAGGFGLNLTAASAVIHFDPWWNPAAEAQASDRVHRIGQKRAVTIYKLIAAGSIEEKLHKLQQRKRALFENLVNEESFATQLNSDDLRDLLTE